MPKKPPHRKAAERKLVHFEKLLDRDLKRNEQDLLELSPQQIAQAAGLRYVSAGSTGIRRVKKGKGFAYVDAKNRPVKDEATLRRIASLVLPPAWKEVWISSYPSAHLQATGVDARGRLQYRYHPLWRTACDMAKYHRMIPFGESLPKIRRRIEQDLHLPDLPREKVLAAVVRLLEETLIRIGNEEYAKTNNSFGLATLHNKHIDVRGGKLKFHFKGKSGKEHDIEVEDKEIAPIIRECMNLPGKEVFEYVDELGKTHDVKAQDVNAYLQQITGKKFTAKDFRTWAGTVYAALALCDCEPCTTNTEMKRNIVKAIESVSEKLGNTPAVCKKSYVHPLILESYLDDTMPLRVRKHLKTGSPGSPGTTGHGLSVGERAVLRFLKECFVS